MGSLRGCVLQKHGGVRIQEIGFMRLTRIDGDRISKSQDNNALKKGMVHMVNKEKK